MRGNQLKTVALTEMIDDRRAEEKERKTSGLERSLEQLQDADVVSTTGKAPVELHGQR